jgi:thiamine pyrophosphokinase
VKAVILAGGRLVPSARLAPLIEGAGLVVAADSGLRHARLLRLEPAAIVGDFDSVSAADLEAYPEVPRLRFPARKDLLDLELAIDFARERGASELTILGAFGTRLDQSLACLLIGARLRREGLAISLHDGERDAFPAVAGERLRLELPAGTVFSLLALEDSRCSVGGADYPLERAELPFGIGLGVANRARGGPDVEVHEGLVAVIVEWTSEEREPPEHD